MPYTYKQQMRDAGKTIKLDKVKVKNPGQRRGNVYCQARQVSPLCAKMKIGDMVEVMFNNSLCPEKTHFPKWYLGKVVDLEGGLIRQGGKYYARTQQFWVSIEFPPDEMCDDATIYDFDRFGRDSFEMFRAPVPEEEENNNEGEISDSDL